MTWPMTILSIGAAAGVGAVAAPVYGSLLSTAITGETVPARITDLASYLAAPSSARGLAGFEDEDLQQSIGTPDVIASPLKPKPGTKPDAPRDDGPPSEKKRMLAAAAFGAALATAGIVFVIVHRVLR